MKEKFCLTFPESFEIYSEKFQDKFRAQYQTTSTADFLTIADTFFKQLWKYIQAFPGHKNKSLFPKEISIT